MVKEMKEKKSGFNIVDLIIVLFIVLAAVGIVLRLNLIDEIQFNAYGETFEIEFIIGDIQEASEVYLRPGDKFYINIESLEIGTIKEIHALENDPIPAYGYYPDVHGNLIKGFPPGRIEVRGIMTSKGRTTKDGEVMINGNSFVAANTEFYVHTGLWEGSMTVLSVNSVTP